MIFLTIVLWILACQSHESETTSGMTLPLEATAIQSGQDVFEKAEQIRLLLVNDQIVEEEAADHLKQAFEELAQEKELEGLAARGQKIAESFRASENISASRSRFSQLSAVLIALGGLDASFREGRAVFECPMVDYFPKWIQPAGEMANPYMGQAMLVCGVATDWTGAEELLGPVHESDIAYHTCPMHPDVKQAEMGVCPICNMDLVPVSAEELNSGTVLIDGLRRQKTAISTQPVELGPVHKTLSTYGTIRPDERYVHVVSLRFDGWVEESNALRIGQSFRKGEPLFRVYSPEVYTAQQEYLIGAGHQDSTRRKLELLGLSDAWIRELSAQKKLDTAVPILAPESGVILQTKALLGSAVKRGETVLTLADTQHLWLDVEIFSQQGPELDAGASMDLSIDGRSYKAKLLDRLPSRGLGQAEILRFAIEQLEGAALQLEQVVSVTVQQDEADVLRLPMDSVIFTGERQIVFVDIGADRLQPRDIQVGRRNAAWIEVLSGLEAGENIVSKGVFLVASESRIQSATTFWAGDEDADQP